MSGKSAPNVTCEQCGVKFHLKPSRIARVKYNFCSQKCCNEHKIIRYSGANNPNRRYNYDDNFFDEIDSEFKAWFLGWILSDGGISKTGAISLKLHKNDVGVLKTIQQNFCKDIPIININNKNQVSYSFSSKKMVQQIKDFGGLLNPNSFRISRTVAPRLDKMNQQFIKHFIRGYFEGDGHITNIFKRKCGNPSCKITSLSEMCLNIIKQYMKLPSTISSYFLKDTNVKIYDLHYNGTTCIDFLGILYDGARFKLQRKYERYINICNWSPKIVGNQHYIDNIKVQRTDKMAVIPTKANVSDSGYDLTIIKHVKTDGEMMMFDTCIALQPPHGFYIDVVPRSSISKSGYILLNSVGIIDRGYVGSIKLALMKVDKSKPDIQLPCKIAQAILRPVFHVDVIEVEELSDTSRGEGGFGSTGR